MYNRLILNRIRSVIDIRPKRSTVAQILTLRRIIEGVKANNIEAVMTFIDFKKAFDSIHRGKMMRILKAYGIPPNLLQAIEMMYTNTKAKVLSPDGETEMFDITTGVLHPKVVLADLDFADDIALLSDEIAQAQELLLTVEKECKKVGLVLNAKKTKSVAYNIDDPYI